MTAISALMMTTVDRWWFCQLAAEAWLLNEREKGDELAIVCEEPVDLGFAHPRIRAEVVPLTTTLAAKRNLGVQACRGEVIAFWDDDDWHGVRRISAIRTALAAPAINHERPARPMIVGQTSYYVHELTGLRRLLRWDHGAGRLEGMGPPERYVVGGTMAFSRKLALELPFVEQVTKGDEGWWTVDRLREDAPYAVMPLSDYVAMIHGSNTCARTPRVDEHGFVMSDHQMTLLGGVEKACDIIPAPVLARYVTATFAQRDKDRG